MANALYDTFKEAILNKEHDLSVDNIHVTLVDSADYTFSAAHVDYATDLAGGTGDVATFGPLTSPTIVDGLFDTADFTWSTVTGDVSEAIVIWNETLVPDTFIAFYDTGMTGMPVTPNGGDINVTVNGSGWFTL